MKGPKAVIFDFDGVLVDSEPFWAEADRQIVQAAGGSLRLDVKRAVIGLRQTEAVRTILSMHGINADPADFRAQREEIMEGFYRTRILLFPAARSVVRQLGAAGFALAVASSTPARLVELALRRHDLRDAFASVISAEDVLHGKPAPDIFLRALDELETVGPEAVIVEDSLPGIIGAQAAQATTVWIRNLHAPEAAGRAEYAIDSLAELPALVGLNGT